MTLWLQRLVSLVADRGWRLSAAILLALFVFGWIGMIAADPTSELARPDIYWWWFLVTITTVGYGDFFPDTTASRVIGGVVVVGGIAAMGVVIAHLTSMFQRIRSALMHGLTTLEISDHLVIFGYHAGRTEELVREFGADGSDTRADVVLCFDSEQAQENPMPQDVLAVRGRLSSRDVLERACLDRAARVVIDGRDDNETLAIALAVNRVTRGAHVVAAVESVVDAAEQMSMVSPAIECVPRGVVPLIVQAALDPGISRLYLTLMTNLHGNEGYMLVAPRDGGPWRWLDLLVDFKRHHDATLVGFADSSDLAGAELQENPPAHAEVPGGAALYYIAQRRIVQVQWPEPVHAARAAATSG